MPYLAPRGSTYVAATAATRGAFEVSDETARQWELLSAQSGVARPRDWNGRLLRPYPALDVPSHRPYAPDGVYVDHRDPAVEQAAYEQRDRVLRASAGERQAVLEGIRQHFGLRHWRDAYNAVRNVGRRITGESGRDASGELRWRAWGGRTWSPAAIAASSEYRRFGIEIESFGTGYHTAPIEAAARAEGLTFVARWNSYRRDPSVAGWQGTYDGSISGGTEIISDLLDGSDAAHDEVRTMLRIVRANGGVTGAGQGMHVNHDTSDFTAADKVRLLDNLRAVAPHLDAWLPASRRRSHWAQPLSADEWDRARRNIAAGQSCGVDRYRAFNLNHLHRHDGQCRVEFRQLGHTLNGRKVRVWIRIGQAIMAASKAGATIPAGATLDEALDVLRGHGLTTWASEQFAATVANRAGRGVAA